MALASFIREMVLSGFVSHTQPPCLDCLLHVWVTQHLPEVKLLRFLLSHTSFFHLALSDEPIAILSKSLFFPEIKKRKKKRKQLSFSTFPIKHAIGFFKDVCGFSGGFKVSLTPKGQDLWPTVYVNYWAVQSSPHSPTPFGPFQGHQAWRMPLPAPAQGKGILQAQWLGLYEVKSDMFRAKLVQLHSCCKWRNRVTQTSSSWVILLQDYGDGGLQLAATDSNDPPWSTRDIRASSGLYH